MIKAGREKEKENKPRSEGCRYVSANNNKEHHGSKPLTHKATAVDPGTGSQWRRGDQTGYQKRVLEDI
jgi:hypothetical protein